MPFVRIDADDCWIHFISSRGIEVEIPQETLTKFGKISDEYQEMLEYLENLYDEAWKRKTLKEKKK